MLHLKKTDQIGLIRKRCADNGITKISDIAQAYTELRDIQAKAGFWCYENFTEKGSNSSGIVSSEAIELSKQCVIFPINHYLGLNRHPDVIQAGIEALQNYGTGCGTSAMSGGHNRLHKTLEKRLAQAMNKEAAILFPTGYSANLGAISALAKTNNSVILFDRECHASIIDGAKLAGCKYIPFKHNDVADLEKKLKTCVSEYENIFVIVESVYSMSGEESPLCEIVNLKKSYPFYFFVDEAHAFGFYDVGGLCRKLGISSDVDFIMTTLSKSTASVGGVIATSRKFITLLQVEANAYLFQAALTPADAATALKALDVIESTPQLVESLWAKTAYFRNKLLENGFDTGNGRSPIVPVFIRNSETLFNMSKELLENGIFSTAVAYPVVKHSEVRFRFIINESHSYEQLDYTISVLTKLGEKFGILNYDDNSGDCFQ
jgi:glycine C-acetyltransferase